MFNIDLLIVAVRINVFTLCAEDVLVIRYEGPKGSPGMPEMLSPGSALVGAGLGKHVALVTDGRFRREEMKHIHIYRTSYLNHILLLLFLLLLLLLL